jgi:hypothetical protein
MRTHVDLDDYATSVHEIRRQSRAVRTGSFDGKHGGGAERLGPPEQLRVAPRAGGHLETPQQTTGLVERCGDVDISVGVDTHHNAICSVCDPDVPLTRTALSECANANLRRTAGCRSGGRCVSRETAWPKCMTHRQPSPALGGWPRSVQSNSARSDFSRGGPPQSHAIAVPGLTRAAPECKRCRREATCLAASVVHPHRRVRDLAFGLCASVEHDHAGKRDVGTASFRPQPVHSARAALSRPYVAGNPVSDTTGVVPRGMFCA